MALQNVAPFALAQELPAAQLARVKKLENSLLAPCCYGEPVSRHMSQIAFQMRKEITDKVAAGQSDQEILNYYKALYGDQVLVEPDGRKKLVLYSLPVLISLAGLGIALLFLRQWTKPDSAAAQAAAAAKVMDSRIAETIRNATEEL